MNGPPPLTSTRTFGAGVTSVPTSALFPLVPATIWNVSGAAVVALAVKESDRVPAVAVNVLLPVPTTEPSVHSPTVAMPLAPVTAGEPVTLPLPPLVTLGVNVTLTPLFGLPYWSLTMTDGRTRTAVP